MYKVNKFVIFELNLELLKISSSYYKMLTFVKFMYCFEMCKENFVVIDKKVFMATSPHRLSIFYQYTIGLPSSLASSAKQSTRIVISFTSCGAAREATSLCRLELSEGLRVLVELGPGRRGRRPYLLTMSMEKSAWYSMLYPKGRRLLRM